jgi:hypothetical protein
MANLKIIWTTGSPFSLGCIDKIAYETSPGKWNVYRDGSWTSQTTYSSDSYRPATAKEIAEHWKVLHPMWTPEPGDKVIITQDHYDWHNKRAVIVEKHSYEDYWRIKKEDGEATVFSKSTHMILAPYEETAKHVETSKPTIPIPKEGYTTIKFYTEEEFKALDRWVTYGSKGYPKGWNNEGYMNKYLGTYILIRKSDFKADHSFNYEDWHFRVTDYQIIRESVEPKPEPKVELEPEMKPQRFKVGDKVTYRFRSDCKDNYYRWGGDDHGGYVGTIKSYDSYQPDYNCYGIKVTSREGEYTMLESEFYEYDGTYSGNVTLGTSTGSNLRVISSGTTDTPYIQTSGIIDYRPPVTKEDVLAKYNQAPVTLHKKPKTKLITVNTY